MTPQWTREGDNVRCRHGKLFDPSKETCAECVSGPPIVVDAIDQPLPKPPTGCASSDQHERKLVAIATELEAKARALLPSKGRLTVQTALRCFEIAIKARRAAAEFTSTRERRAYVKAREKRIRDRDRMRGSKGN